MDGNGYIYDGSFEGLLTCIFEAISRRENPCFIMESGKYRERISGTLFPMIESPRQIDTDQEKAGRVYSALDGKLPAEALETIYRVHLSDAENAETMTLRYVRLGFKAGFDLDKLLQDKSVMDMVRLERRVMLEAHRMEGFLRFQENQGFYYAKYEPDHNITELITPHFAERFRDQAFIIHDVKRSIASVCRSGEWFLTAMDLPAAGLYGEGPDFYEELWKGYFRWASIDERSNPKNQKRQMPKRYWKHLTEI
jgi:probable DNA metabolism protein